MTTNLHNFLRSRRSIRRYKTRPVPADVLRRILETAAYAPSAHNDQPWRFAVLTDDETKVRLAEAMAANFRHDLEKDGLSEKDIAARLERSRSRITDAPVVVILCMDTSTTDTSLEDKHHQAETMMKVQSTTLAGLQLLLAAHAEGLGGVWTCGPLFAADTVCAALALPPKWQPQAMFFIGYPAEEPQTKTVKSLEEVVRFI